MGKKKNGNGMNDRARQVVAQEAARIIINQGIRDYRVAKIKAAERLGLHSRGSLPGNAEVERAIEEHHKLFGGDQHLDLLRRMRQAASAAMELLWEEPEYWDVGEYPQDINIVHISSLLAGDGIIDRLKEQIQVRFEGLKLACYYGCLSLRHPKITGVINYEQPRTLETIVATVGAEPVSWSHKTECCSGSLTMARPDIARRLVSDIVEAARRAGAEGMVTDCPMCQANVESRQLDLAGNDHLPVFFGTELISAALSGQYPAKQKKVHLVDASVLDDVLRRAPQLREETV